MGAARDKDYKTKRVGPKKKQTKEDYLTKASALPNSINMAVAWNYYGLEKMKCELHIPKKPKTRNCTDNPFCIHRIGLEKWQKLRPKKNEEPENKLVRRDTEKQPCGLVNSGNYCYVNSFLQIWYNDLIFRQCVYDWRPDSRFQTDDKFNVQAVMDCLQELFITLQITPYLTTDANDFIKLLDLNNEQQDVQEFAIMFFDVLDRKLSQHPNGAGIRDLIRERIEGRQAQNVFCPCGRSNMVYSEFKMIQLHIDGCKTLNDAIERAHAEEELPDFTCDQCNEKGNVKRKNEIVTLPPVLLFTLNRYVFDERGRSKKLTSALQYPKTLQEKFLFPKSDQDRTYELCAVMIHVGANAHCGHYYDLIKDPFTNQWYSYNDMEVKPQKTSPGFVDEPKPQSKPPPETKGCYGLIYRRVDAVGAKSINELKLPPPEVYTAIDRKLNDKFNRESKEGDRSTNVWHARIEERADFLEKLWKDLEISKGKDMLKLKSDVAFIPLKLLSEIQAKEYKSVEEMREIYSFLDCDENQNVEKKPDQLAELQKEAEEKEDLSQEIIDRIAQAMEEEAAMKEANDESLDNGVKKANQTLTQEDIKNFGEMMYEIEPIEDTQIRLCGHNKISLEAVLKGEIKAVNRVAAERLLENYKIGLDERDSDEIDDSEEPKLTKLLTGSDICIDCVEQTKKDANFDAELSQKIEIVNSILKEKSRIHDPNKDIPGCEVPPPEGAVWCSFKQLHSYKRLANQQVDYDRSLRASSKAVYFSTKIPGFRKCVRSSSRNVSMSTAPLISNDIAGITISDLPRLSDKVGIRGKRRKASNFVQMTRSTTRTLSDTEERPHKKPMLSVTSNGTMVRKRSISENGLKMMADSPTKKLLNSPRKISEKDEEEEDGVELRDTESNENDEMDVEEAENSEKPVNTPDLNKEKHTNGVDESKDVSPAKTSPVEFNEDLKCAHGCLTYEVKRIWLLKEEWDRLVDNIFPLRYEVACTQEECRICVHEFYEKSGHNQQCSVKLERLNEAIGKKLRVIEKRQNAPSDFGTVYTHVLCGNFPTNFSKAVNKSRSKDKVVDSIPEICQDCLLCEDHRKPFRYLEHPHSLAVTKDEWEMLVDAYREVVPEQTSPTEIMLLDNGSLEDFCSECFENWGRLEEEKRYNYPEGADIFVKTQKDAPDDDEPVVERRVNTRRLAARNLMKFHMSSTDKIINLKLKIYEKTAQPPIDQLLMKNGVALESEQTLEEAKVAANNHEDPIILIVQERIEANEPRVPEKGFRDTALSSY